MSTPASWKLPAELVHDWRGLMDLIQDTARRQPVPCRDGTTVPVAYWTSDSPAERRLAAEACGHCPVLTQCRTYRLAHPKEVGVYGGASEQARN